MFTERRPEAPSLSSHPEPLEAVPAFDALMGHLYWEKKDLDVALAFAEAGIIRNAALPGLFHVTTPLFEL